MSTDPLIRIEQLKKYYPITGGVFSQVVNQVKAVDGVDLSIFKGETLGLVGESGCGKTTLGKTILRLEEPTAGRIVFREKNVAALNKKNLRRLRRQLQIIFQDPYSSLNPRKTVRKIIGDPLLLHGLVRNREEKERRVLDLLREVGLRPDHIDRYPHEFSGGQRQRIGIARALALNPELIVCDEPVSALDVSIQAQVLNLLADLQEKYHLTYLFITHDLSVVTHISNRIAVMYLGHLVEIGPGRTVYHRPYHPYTEALISASPVADTRASKQRTILRGDVPSPIDPPPGCPFHPRCPKRFESCDRIYPQMIEVEAGHRVRCLLYEDTNQQPLQKESNT